MHPNKTPGIQPFGGGISERKQKKTALSQIKRKEGRKEVEHS
jgi:hypothetical protein